MGFQVRHCLLIGVLFSAALLLAATPVKASFGEDQGYLAAIRHKFASVWPFGDKLGHDWTDTQDRVESIYQKTHAEAQKRVDELKEETVAQADIQKQIAEIYQEEAAKAEREIEALKHPLMGRLTSWITSLGREPTPAEKKDFFERLGWNSMKQKAEDIMPHHIYDDTTKKISATYKLALEAAKVRLSDASDKGKDLSGKAKDLSGKAGEKLGEAGSAASQGWYATKARAAQAYNEAFHKGHFESRSKFAQFRDMMGRGIRGVGSITATAAYKTVELVWWLLSSTFLMALGGFITLYAMKFWNKQQLRKQLHSHVAGPVQACGEYYVVGNEVEQKKFYDFWSGTGYAYFSKQPGLRKYWMHRGVAGAENNWLSYSEWASIDDLRRACSTTEYVELRNRSPGYPVKQMHIYQLVSNGAARGAANVNEGEILNKDTGSVRQRTTTTTTAAT